MKYRFHFNSNAWVKLNTFISLEFKNMKKKLECKPMTFIKIVKNFTIMERYSFSTMDGFSMMERLLPYRETLIHHEKVSPSWNGFSIIERLLYIIEGLFHNGKASP